MRTVNAKKTAWIAAGLAAFGCRNCCTDRAPDIPRLPPGLLSATAVIASREMTFSPLRHYRATGSERPCTRNCPAGAKIFHWELALADLFWSPGTFGSDESGLQKFKVDAATPLPLDDFQTCNPRLRGPAGPR